MQFVKFILVLKLIAGINRTQMCPANFNSVGDRQCMLLISQVADYCGSHKLCEEESQSHRLRLFVPGLHLQKMSAYFPNVSVVHTSLNLLLNSWTIKKAGWRFGDPRHASSVTNEKDTTIPWTPKNPNTQRMGVAIWRLSLLRDYQRGIKNATEVNSEMSIELPRKKTVEDFRQNWPNKLDSMFFPDEKNWGCFQSSTERSQLACAYK